LGLIDQSEQATITDLGQDKVLEETPDDNILISSVDQSGTHQKVDASADQLQSSPAQANPPTEDPIEVEFLLMFPLTFPIFNPLFFAGSTDLVSCRSECTNGLSS
jgi:hypothetical protein